MGDFRNIKTIRSHYKTPAAKERVYVQDADLQVYVPSAVDTAQDLEEAHIFRQAISQYLESLNSSPHETGTQVQKLVEGHTERLKEVMQAVDQADSGFKMMMEIRNKLVSAYNEVMHMQN